MKIISQMLVNPTDGMLNEAFVQKVCGWVMNGDYAYSIAEDGGLDFQGNLPNFTDDMNKVLPWLGKYGNFQIANGWQAAPGIHGVRCAVWIAPMARNGEYIGWANTAPKACVIALLRAHGVQIEGELTA